tara:strand:+ start:146 stop:376 length:231 start_codon:yes stop_codon:yes gene_type:complete
MKLRKIFNMSKDNYEENDERMNIIGQNGNDGLHYEHWMPTQVFIQEVYKIAFGSVEESKGHTHKEVLDKLREKVDE